MIHKVKLGKGEVLTKADLTKMINNARSSYDYFKVTLHNGIYFTIEFNRDNTVEIMTNTRDIAIWNQLRILQANFSQLRAVDQVFDWINTLKG